MQSVFSPPRALPAIECADGAVRTPSSMGMSDSLGNFSPTAFVAAERWRELVFREKFFTCKQHDHKLFDFNGNMRRVGGPSAQPYIAGAMPTQYVQLDQRRPDAPFRVGRLLVNSFTTLIFGHGQFPALSVVGDPDTQDYAQALIDAQRLPAKMIRARSIGGSIGTVGLSWRFYEGLPRLKVHKGYRLWVHEWEDRDELIPSHVTEVYQVVREQWNVEKARVERVLFWHRQDWTPKADVTFREMPVEDGKDPEWVVERYDEHGDGFAHFVWIQNLPSDDDDSVDGQPDYAEQYENMNSVDVLHSVSMKGAIRNLDPTLVIKSDQALGQVAVRKGSDNFIAPGKDGDANYLELAGTSITSGLELRKRERDQILEVAQCVSPSPDTIAAAGTSSLGIKMVYFPMLGKGDVLRDQYGQAMERLIEQQIRSARRHLGKPSEDGESIEYPDVEEGEDGEAKPVEFVVALPPRVVEEDVLGEDGKPTGEVHVRLVERRPGKGGVIKFDWPEYFERTDDDRQKRATALTTATGGRAVMSQRSAVEKMAADYKLDPIEEWQRVAQANKEQAEAQSGMFPGAGGEVGGVNELPDGAPKGPEEPEPPSIDELADVLTVDEMRARAKPPLPPWPNPEEGRMTVAEFAAKRKSAGTEAGKVVGTAKGQAEAGKAAQGPAPAQGGPQDAPTGPEGGNPLSRVPMRPEPTGEPPG